MSETPSRSERPDSGSIDHQQDLHNPPPTTTLENITESPLEKVDGLKIMATAGLPVPAVRHHKIIDARSRMIEMAEPSTSLQIRRDLKHRAITDYDPTQMGIFINSLIDKGAQITVVLLSDGSLRLSYIFNFDPSEFAPIYVTITIPASGDLPDETMLKIKNIKWLI